MRRHSPRPWRQSPDAEFYRMIVDRDGRLIARFVDEYIDTKGRKDRLAKRDGDYIGVPMEANRDLTLSAIAAIVPGDRLAKMIVSMHQNAPDEETETTLREPARLARSYLKKRGFKSEEKR